MTIRDLVQWLGGHSWILVATFVAIPLLAYLLPFLHGPACNYLRREDQPGDRHQKNIEEDSFCG